MIAALSNRGFTWSKSIIQMVSFRNVGQGSLDDFDHVLTGAAQHVLGPQQVSLPDASPAEGFHGGDPVIEFLFLGDLLFVGQVVHPAGNHAEHVDLVVQVAHQDGIQVRDLLGAELAGVEAVFDGVGIAWLSSAGAFGICHI